MRYHLFLNSFRKVLKIAKVFSRKLAVPRYMSTSVSINRLIAWRVGYLLRFRISQLGLAYQIGVERGHTDRNLLAIQQMLARKQEVLEVSKNLVAISQQNNLLSWNHECIPIVTNLFLTVSKSVTFIKVSDCLVIAIQILQRFTNPKFQLHLVSNE